MKVLVSGSSGLIGSVLMPALQGEGHTVVPLIRGASGSLDLAPLRDIDAVVHLAGESIAAGRWTPARKARILESRVRGTALLARALSTLDRKPAMFLSGSAVGFYGDRGDELLDETAPRGRGFLADVCAQWEEATAPAVEARIPVVTLRTGVVLSGTGGALRKMLTPFQLGAGGVIGAGTQYMSWIAIDDVVAAIQHLLRSGSVTGPVNLVAPNAVTNREFTKTLGRVLGRPTVFAMPAFVTRLAFGEMADEMLLASTRVRPARLTAAGYQFRYPALEGALRHVIP